MYVTTGFPLFPLFKYLPANKLIELLSTLQDGWVVSPNDINNLAIYKESDDSFEFVGWIDFLHDGTIELGAYDHERPD